MSAALAGLWQMIRAESNGEPSGDLVALRVELELATDTYCVRFAGKVADRGLFSSTNDTLTLRGTEGPNAGRTIPCLFQLVGDRLRVCYGLDGTLPAAFTTAGTANYLATYRRNPPTP